MRSGAFTAMATRPGVFSSPMRPAFGKTHVAREVIAQTVEHLQKVDDVERIDIVYVCSNADIAAQNIRKLNVTGAQSTSYATRLTLLVTQPELLKPTGNMEGKPTTFVAFTPATSFQFGWQMGQARERAVLCVLLSDHLGLRGKWYTAAQRIFQGAVSTRQRFYDWHIAPVRAGGFEGGIHKEFLTEFDRSCLRESLASLVEDVAGRSALTIGQREAAREIVGGLRQMLARAAAAALEPDLVILDEFQRFRDLLDVRTGEAAELADYFFRQPDAHVLLLSATPYKPFTYAEEAPPDADHYADFLKTLEFLADSDSSVESVREDLDALRQAALSGEPTAAIRDRVQGRLRTWIARTERPPVARQTTTLDSAGSQARVRAEDFAGFVALRNIADAVRAPLTVEYWKSSPYFLNFLQRISDRGARSRRHEGSGSPGPTATPIPRCSADPTVRRGPVPADRVGKRPHACPCSRDTRSGLVATALDAPVSPLPFARRSV